MKTLLLAAAAASLLAVAGGARPDDKPATAAPADARPAPKDSAKTAQPAKAEKAAPWERKAEPSQSEDEAAVRRTGSGGMYDCGSSLSMKGHH